MNLHTSSPKGMGTGSFALTKPQMARKRSLSCAVDSDDNVCDAGLGVR